MSDNYPQPTKSDNPDGTARARAYRRYWQEQKQAIRRATVGPAAEPAVPATAPEPDNTEVIMARLSERVEQHLGLASEQAQSYLATLQQQAQAQLATLQQQVEALSQQLQSEAHEINGHSLKVQHDSVNTQQLSQEINRHSLALNEASRHQHERLTREADQSQRLNADGEALQSQLRQLGEQLEQTLNRANQEHNALTATRQALVRQADQSQTRTQALNTETLALHEQTQHMLTVAGAAVDTVNDHKLSCETLTENLTQSLDQTVNERLDEYRAKAESCLNELRDQAGTATQACILATQDCQQSQADNLALQAAFAALRNQIADQQCEQLDEIASLNQRLANVQALLATQIDGDNSQALHQRLADLEQRMHDPSTDNGQETISELVKHLNQAMGASTVTNDALRQVADRQQSDHHQLQHADQRLQEQLAAVERLSRGYEHRLADLERHNNRQAEELAEFKQREADTRQVVRQLQRANRTQAKPVIDAAVRDELDDHSRPRHGRLAAVMSVILMFVTSLAVFNLTDIGSATASRQVLNAPATMPQDLMAALALRLASESTVSRQSSAPLPRNVNQAQASIARLGSFAWPLSAGVIDPASIEYQTHHKGISIDADLGDPVVAVNDGQVIYSADEIRGYGTVIVIRHDDELLSLYANNQASYVMPGDAVKRGQLIGDVGRLFDQDTAGLYLEMRYAGEAQDPFNYLADSVSPDMAAAFPLTSH